MRDKVDRSLKSPGVIFAALLGLAVLAGCIGKPGGGANAQPGAGKNPAAATRGAYFKTSFQNESEFIVQSIATDLAEMALYAKNQAAPPTNVLLVTARETPGPATDAPIYQIVVRLPGNELAYTLQVNPTNATIWSPETYAGLTLKIFGALGLKGGKLPPEKTPDMSLLDPLLELGGTTIERENERISGLLSGNFTNAVLHEEAALLLGAFALRENSGRFFEIRSPLCRMTAHLALARALADDSPYGANGRVAEALLYTLMNDEKPALAKIALFNPVTPELDAWSRALTARNTHDFRPLAAIQKRTTLETIEYFRAYRIAVDGDLAWNKLTDAQRIGMADPCRIINARDCSAGLGHVMLQISIPLEVGEATNVFQLARRRTLVSNREFVAALNELPDRCVGCDAAGAPVIHVIGWGQWAMFFQRHLCQAIVSNYRFMAESWGVPEEARVFSERCDGAFSELRLYPFVRKFTCRDEKSYHAAIDDSLAVVRSTPQIVASGVWNELYYYIPFAALYRPDSPGRVDEWHSHNPPSGTAYDPYPRFDHSNLVRCADAQSRLQKMYELAPYDCDVEYACVFSKYQGRATYEQAEPIFHPVLEYDSYQIYLLAQKLTNQPAAFEVLMCRAAALDPVRYYMLAEHLINHGQDAQAIPYIKLGMELCEDKLWKASFAGKMIRYYLKNGQTAQAARLADEAAEVYSTAGLTAKAEFLEATGRYSEALAYYKMNEERYNDSEGLINFCRRYKAKTGRKDFDETLARRTRAIFPKGLEKVSLDNFSGPPRDGLLVGEENTETVKAGLKQGNVIVALDGIRVHTLEQYLYARSAGSSPELDLIVWQGNEYREIKARPNQRSFGAKMPTYFAN